MDGEQPVRRIALLLEYDGTAFAGSQWQPNARTVQEVLEAAVLEFTGERDRISFAGRTDSGVHASGQVAALRTSTQHSLATCRDALNHFLPEDVVVRGVAEVAVTFDPRRHAEARRYRYRIVDGRARSPLERHRSWWVERPLDVSAMAAAMGGRIAQPGREHQHAGRGRFGQQAGQGLAFVSGLSVHSSFFHTFLQG